MKNRSSMPFLGGSATMNPERLYKNVNLDGELMGNSDVMNVETLGNALLGTFGAFAVGIALTITLLKSAFSNPMSSTSGSLMGLLAVSVIGTLVLSIVNSFKRKTSPALVMAFAVFEGVLVASTSAVYNYQYNGIVLQAVVATACVIFASIALFKSGIIAQNRSFFARVIPIVLLSYFLMSIVNFILVLTGVFTNGGVYSSSLGIGISAFAIVLGAIMLAQDLDSAQMGVDMGAPSHYAWKCTFGILLDVVWIYLEILRLLAVLSRRD